MNTTQTKLPKAVEEFIKKFVLISSGEQVGTGNVFKNYSWKTDSTPKEVIKFLTEALQTQTEEYRKRIEELNVYYQGDGDKPEIDYLKKSEVLNIFKETK